MLSPKLFTECLQDISKSFDKGQGIPVETFYASLWHIIVSIPKTNVPILEYASDIWYTGDGFNDLEKKTSKMY